MNWGVWLCCSDDDRRPPLWWRVIMLVLASAAPFGIQMTSASNGASNDSYSYFVDIMRTAEYRGQIPNLDIWTWDTASMLQILQTHLFGNDTNQAAVKALTDCRSRTSPFNVDMSFGEGFDCLKDLLTSLEHTEACSLLQEFRSSVSSWFPAFGEDTQMQPPRSQPLLLTTRQHDAFKTHVLDNNGRIKPRCRLRFECAASSGKTVIATILAVEFVLDRISPQGDLPDEAVLYLTHTPILARRAANSVCNQLKLKLMKDERTRRTLGMVQVKRSDASDDCDVYHISVANKQVIVVATINAALQTLQEEIFLGGVVVDGAHAVYGSDRRRDQRTGQNCLPAERIAPIVERWGGARDEHEGASRLVLFGDERNQSVRRRFNDTGEGLVTCKGCGCQRLRNWIDFTNSYYARVQRIFDVLDVDGDGKLSKDEFSSFMKQTGDISGDDFTEAIERGFDIEALSSLYFVANIDTLPGHEKVFGTDGTINNRRKLCAHCALVAKAHSKGITGHECFLGDVEDPIFPLEDDHEHPEKSMKLVARGLLDSNYRQPARIADVVVTSLHSQKRALQVHHVDRDSVQGRAIRYADVKLDVDIKKAVRRLVYQDATTARKNFQNLTHTVSEAYVAALTKELIEACTCVKETGGSERPDVLVLAPRCSDDPEFVHRLKDGCLKQSSRIMRLVKNGQIQFGAVGEWSGSDAPLVILTGFHQPYHLLANVGCFGIKSMLRASRTKVARVKACGKMFREMGVEARKINDYDESHILMKQFCKIKDLPETFEQRHSILEKRLLKVSVDTLLYIAITRATCGLSVVEPFPKRFVAHYQIGTEGRCLSRAGKLFSARWSDDCFGPGEKGPKPMVLHSAHVLLDMDHLESKSLNLSEKALALIPKYVIDLHNIEILDLSVNNLQRLPNELWNLPLRKLNLSHNPSLGRVLLLVFKGAARCVHLQELCLQDIIETEIATVDLNLIKLVTHLKPLQQLELLDLRDNGLPLSLAAQLHRELPQCRIRIAHCPGVRQEEVALRFDEAIAHQSAELDLAGNKINAVEARVLAGALVQMQWLRKFDLGSNAGDIGDVGAAVLAGALKEMQNLEVLNLAGNMLGDDAIAVLAGALKEMQNLEVLNLAENDLSLVGVATLAGLLKQMQNLKELNLHGLAWRAVNIPEKRIGDAAAAALARALKEMQNLEVLNLAANNISHVGAASLVEAFKEMHNLKILDLAWNELGDGGAAMVVEAVKEMQNLEKLYLSCNNISDARATAIVETLKEMQNLTIIFEVEIPVVIPVATAPAAEIVAAQKIERHMNPLDALWADWDSQFPVWLVPAAMQRLVTSDDIKLPDHKGEAKAILLRAGVPVPKGYSYQEAMDLRARGTPLVAKPVRKGGEQSVTLWTCDGAHDAEAARYSEEETLFEEFFPSEYHYRIIVVDGSILGCYRRTLRHVYGDGRSTIRELCDKVGIEPNWEVVKKLNDLDSNASVSDVIKADERLWVCFKIPTISQFINHRQVDEFYAIVKNPHPSYASLAKKVHSSFAGKRVLDLDIIAMRPLQEQSTFVVNAVNGHPSFTYTPADWVRQVADIATRDISPPDLTYTREWRVNGSVWRDDDVTINMIGDISFCRDIAEYVEEHRAGDYTYPMSYVKWALLDADLSVANLECVLFKEGLFSTPFPKSNVNLRGPPAAVRGLVDSGVGMVTIANNHINDFGNHGFRETVRHLREAKLPFFGTVEEPWQIVTIRGIRISLLGVCIPFWKLEAGGVNIVEPDDREVVLGQIRRLKQQTDVVMVVVHWGKEYEPASSSQQRSLARSFVASGADLIVGHHPHVIQNMEVVSAGTGNSQRSARVFYSLGNFMFDSHKPTPGVRDTLILRTRIQRDHSLSFDYVPCKINPQCGYIPLPLTDKFQGPLKPGEDLTKVCRGPY